MPRSSSSVMVMEAPVMLRDPDVPVMPSVSASSSMSSSVGFSVNCPVALVPAFGITMLKSVTVA